ncbi:hypothetical protein T069G_01433 [Trichoderma breve]|uniref:DUF202 domain-containing protein n=1 Tax=Trichoderma breve TaxID=2034170 RepID=A0A9W9EDX4_9HYPO|nr:hypothetical protein T069G_01433 [Trichoderma breve]KAJ4864903.1 hypothetical protein T069G_01433 [Trichoderma breve]
MSDEEGGNTRCCAPFLALTEPIEVSELGSPDGLDKPSAFFQWPWPSPLLFINESSDARDHCANERTFLSYLRLSIYMAIVSVAITVSFHIKGTPSDLERRVAKPLGGIFWVLSVVTLALGAGNYISEIHPSLSAIYLPLSSLGFKYLQMGTNRSRHLFARDRQFIWSKSRYCAIWLEDSGGVGYNSHFNHWNVHHIVSRR